MRIPLIGLVARERTIGNYSFIQDSYCGYCHAKAVVFACARICRLLAAMLNLDIAFPAAIRPAPMGAALSEARSRSSPNFSRRSCHSWEPLLGGGGGSPGVGEDPGVDGLRPSFGLRGGGLPGGPQGGGAPGDPGRRDEATCARLGPTIFVSTCSVDMQASCFCRARSIATFE